MGIPRFYCPEHHAMVSEDELAAHLALHRDEPPGSPAEAFPSDPTFAARLSVDAATACWLWTGAITSNGYGVLRRDDVKRYASRYALELRARGALPADREVRRKCRSAACCNPAHLYLSEQRRGPAA